MDNKKTKKHNVWLIKKAGLLASAILAVSFPLMVSGVVYVPQLLKAKDNPTVYYVADNGFKIAIPSAKIFLSYKFKWGNIKTVSQTELNSHPDALYIKLAGSSQVYRLEGMAKRLVTAEAAQSLKLDSRSAVALNKTHFNFYQNGPDVTAHEIGFVLQGMAGNLESGSEGAECYPDPGSGGEDGCIIYQAMEKNDVTICEGIASQNWKGICYSAFVPEAGDPLINCRKLTDAAAKSDCAEKIAVRKKDQQLCSLASSFGRRLICLSNVAIASKNPNACNILFNQDSQVKDTCNFSYALVNKDSSFCGKISDQNFKTNCLNNFLPNQQISQ
ncbi:MAG: hypothetical protein M1383_05455 [Patescibacteria group bacterium]|nr:hypothetical protein [Patescibacteria group bacterium]